MSSSDWTCTEDDLLEHFGDILIALEEVKLGLFSTRLETKLPTESPLGLLYAGINQMIEALGEERARSAAYQAELEEKLATIELQQSSIRELSTPVIELWEGVLCLPMIGAMDEERSAQMADALLTSIVEKKAGCVLIDVTGIEMMDTKSVDAFLRMGRAVRLLGADCMLTGIHPKLAQAIVHLDVDLSGIVTYRTLRVALTRILSRTRGVRAHSWSNPAER